MSTPDQPETPQLTRRQLREIRNTASTPIITPDMARAETGETPVTDAAAEAPAEVPAPASAPVAPLPRAAVPVDIPEAPIADSAVDLGGHALTRRAARQQERLRTAAIPVQSAAPAGDAPADGAAGSAGQDAGDPVEELVATRDDAPEDSASTGPVTAVIEAEPDVAEDAEPASAEAAETAVDEAPASDDSVPVAAEDAEPVEPGEHSDAAEPEEAAPAVAGAAFGLGRSDEPAEVDIEIALPPSFDQMLPRGGNSGASLSTANALILSQTPETGSLVSPVAATGEVLITGTFALPDTYGSTGRVPGSADGKDVDAVLLDGELPSASSPTPIAASAAVSTIKSAEDIIRPPAPEKGSKLMMALAITAGVLALALAGVLILAFVTGVF
ncbi:MULTISPECIES: hypothetical protein [Microbacterium]|uniref:Uncharacterized protein n=1 Tax=Microbacterium saccharophilum TaxID=1213358 RepID=A0A7Z7GCR6_9MICO|nr:MULTISPECIES: hypothetical protein [Microbacterium]SFI30103.1 hypothetical protein SAMN04487751_0978 [Microbacterium saccharophilum]